MRIEGDVDQHLLEFVFDAQTSGGLLISVAGDRADELVDRAREAGASSACIIGQVIPREESSLVLRA